MHNVKLNDLQLAWKNLEITTMANIAGGLQEGSLQGIEKAWGDVKTAYDELINANCGNQ